MSLDYKFQSLEGGFPRQLTPDFKRDYSRFGKTWTEVQELLERELRMLSYRVGSVVLQTAHSPFDVRKDGKLRADVRKPEHPGVVLKFDVYDSQQKKYEQMSFECDQFTEWKALFCLHLAVNFRIITVTTNRTICFGELTTNFTNYYSEKAFTGNFRFPIRRCFGSAEKITVKAFSFGENMSEEWRIVPNFPDYEVSNFGQIKRITGGKGVRAGRILKTHFQNGGYLQLNLYRQGKPTKITVHKVVASAFIGERPTGLEINHKDGNKTNNAAINLEYVTCSANHDHVVVNRLGYVGELNGQSKLTPDKIEQIKKLSAIGMSQRQIGKKLGISQGHVSDIVRGKRWSHIK